MSLPTRSRAGLDYRQSLQSLGLSAKVAHAVAEAWPQPATLSTATPGQLNRYGVTPAQARRLRGAVDLGRLASQATTGRFIGDLQRVMPVLWERLDRAEQEMIVVVLLSSRLTLIDAVTVAMGSISTAFVHPREVFRDAIRASASSIILAHNHPSGDPSPSENDHDLTEKIATVGQIIGIPLVDHIVVGRGGKFFSFESEGVMPMV